MNEHEIIKLMEPTFREVLEKPDLEITRDLSAEDVDTWDSLNYMILIVKMEEIFDIKFSANNLINLSNLGDLIDLLIKETSK